MIKDYDDVDLMQKESKMMLAVKKMTLATIDHIYHEHEEEEALDDCAVDKLRDCIKILLYCKEIKK